jgi:hypothetical protein
MKNINKFIWIIIFTFLCVSCNSNPVSQDTIHVVSIKIIYPKLIAEAKKWHEDAVLVNINCDIYHNDNDSRLVQAAFESSEEEYLQLYVRYLDGSVTSKVLTTPIQIKEIHPIDVQSLPFDSTEVLALFINNPDYGITRYSADTFYGFLMLTYDTRIEGNPYLWRLSIDNLSDDFYLDPLTGEFVNDVQMRN